jgi:hypothetical protein
MIDDKKLPRPIEATFYIKPRVIRKVTSLRKVRVTLKNVTRVRDVVTVILRSADLPTSYVDSLPGINFSSSNRVCQFLAWFIFSGKIKFPLYVPTSHVSSKKQLSFNGQLIVRHSRFNKRVLHAYYLTGQVVTNYYFTQ